MNVIDVKDLEAMSPVFRGKMGNRFAELVIRIFAIDRVNKIYDNSSNYTGPAFTRSFLNDLGVNYVIGNAERLKLLSEGAFITVSNHPFGGLDGIMMIDLMVEIRPDYKFMVNKILSLVKTMNENFISVTPKGNKEKVLDATSIHGIRNVLTWLKDGHPIGFFPSGAVSDFSLIELCVRDREWQKSILSLIHSVKVPIVPIRFFDKNSFLFYFLGVINWRVRLIRMPRELFNKRRKILRIGIGNIISVKEQEQFTDGESLGAFLRKAVYEMPQPISFTPRTKINGYWAGSNK